MTLERLVAEAGTDFANSLVALCLVVEAGEVEGAVDSGTLARSEIGADDDQVERISDASEIVLLEL